jgi:thiazole tautomerase (transcriptional regulator TenI)
MHILAISPGLGFQADRWKGVLRSGIDAFMIRERQMEARALLDLAQRVQDLAPELELWVNGRLDVALAAGCGLHAPEAYPEVDAGMLPLSRPLHEEAQWAARNQCAQVLIAPVFASPGKGESWGAARLLRFLEGLSKGPRLLALGGVDPGNAGALKHRRLGGVALIRGLWDAADPTDVVGRLRSAW